MVILISVALLAGPPKIENPKAILLSDLKFKFLHPSHRHERGPACGRGAVLLLRGRPRRGPRRPQPPPELLRQHRRGRGAKHRLMEGEGE